MVEKDIALGYILNVPPIAPDQAGFGSLMSLFLSDMMEDIRWGLLTFKDIFEPGQGGDQPILTMPVGFKAIVTEIYVRQRTVTLPSGTWRIGNNTPVWDNWNQGVGGFGTMVGGDGVGSMRITPFPAGIPLNANLPAPTIPIIDGDDAASSRHQLRLDKVGGIIGALVDIAVLGVAWRTND